MSKTRLSTLVLPFALVLAAPVARAQSATPAAETESSSLEIYAAHSWFDAQGTGSRPTLGGVGGRLMTTFGRHNSMTGGGSWFTRSAFGVFATYTAKQNDNQMTTIHYGAQVDAHLLPTPLEHVLDPFVSLGVGGFRTKVENTGLLGGGSVTNTDLAITPALGSHFHLTPNIAIRGDLRDVIIFGDKTTNNYVAEGGLSLSF